MIRIITMTSVKKISSLVQYFIIGVIAWSFYGVIGLNDFKIGLDGFEIIGELVEIHLTHVDR